MSAPANEFEPLGGRDRAIALAIFAGALVVYGLTLCPTIYIGDSGELCAVASCFGVAHPPGYPLFTLLYGALVHVLPFGDVALCANAITAAIAAATVAMLFLIARQLGVSRLSAVAAATGIAVARQFWFQAVSVEVYALDGLLLAIAVWTSVRLALGAETSRRSWLLAGIAFGLSCGHRPVNLLYIAILAVWIALSRRRAGMAGWMHAVLGAASTGLLFWYLPIAASTDPPMNMGDPDTFQRWWAVVAAQPYRRHIESGTFELALARFGGSLVQLPVQLALTFAAALAGFVRLRRGERHERRLAWVLVLMVAINLAFASIYNILDNDGFYQPTWIALALLAAVGFRSLLARFPTRLTAALLVPVAMVPAVWTWSQASLRGVDEARTYVRDLLRSAEPEALILVSGDTARAGLAYLQVVEAARPDVAVLVASPPLPWQVDEARARSPKFGLPPLRAEDDPAVWLHALVRDRLAVRHRPVYVTSLRAPVSLLVPPELAQRVSLVPSGLLTRIVIAPPDPAFAPQQQRALLEAGARFWGDRDIPTLRSRRPDPQLVLLPVHYAEARFRLAVERLFAGEAALADVDLEAIAGSDVDAREAHVARAYQAIGRDLTPRRFAARSRAGLTALRTGASPQTVLGELTPRPLNK